MTGDTVEIIFFWQMSERKYIKLRGFTKKKKVALFIQNYGVGGEREMGDIIL